VFERALPKRISGQRDQRRSSSHGHEVHEKARFHVDADQKGPARAGIKGGGRGGDEVRESREERKTRR
jgi:hypothetical protein